MRTRRIVAWFSVVIFLVLVFSGRTLALGVETHRIINSYAVSVYRSAVFDQYLRGALGFRNGTATLLETERRQLTIDRWLGEGGIREDDSVRFLHHFHDPLQPLDGAGFGRGPARFASAVKWMDDPDQSWSWPSARILYYKALTETEPVKREALWADLFRAIGQIMHLVVDASVPEHTRNDMHPLGAVNLENSYERWVGSQHAAGSQEAAFVAKYLALPIGFADDVLAHGGVAGLVDANRYDGTNPGITVGPDSRAPVATGLAEISNANFFSEDTLRGQYPSPTDAGLIPVNLTTPLGKVRRYFSRPAGLGLLPANPLRAECASDALRVRGVAIRPAPYPCVDPVVWNQVAMHMLPRAVGYARGVLEYFFRGSLAVSQVTWDDEGVFLEIQNTSSEEMEGVFEIWARQEPDSARERRTLLVALNGGEPVRVGAGEPFWFQGVQIPQDAQPSAKHVLVFRGRLGSEEQAVAAQVFTVPFVEVRQATYTASTEFSCAAPTGTVASGAPKTTFTVRSLTASCGWRIRAHHIAGTIATNMPVNPDTGRAESAVGRIEARWTGDTAPVPLQIDGRSAATAWQRAGDEADPTAFEIADATERPQFAAPFLIVTYLDGRQEVVRLARIASANVSHEKFMLLDNRTTNGPTLIASRRSATGLLWYDWTTQFEAMAHNGVTPPVNGATTRTFGTSGLSEGLFVSQFVYLNMVMDDFQVFGDSSAAQTFYDGITLKAPHPDGPSYGWSAEVRRTYRAGERAFLRGFVTAAPYPFVVRMSGRAAGSTGTQ